MLVIESPKSLVPKFFNKTATTYDRIVAWATFGKDRYWKKEILKQIPEASSFLDLACGTGILTRSIADRFPNAKIIGADITERYLDVAKENSKHYKNITYLQQDAEQLNLGMKFDCITSSYVPKYCNPEILVKACMDHLKPGGKIIFHDFTYPTNKLVRRFWDSYFVLLHLIGFFVPSWKEAFVELPKLIRSSTWLSDYTRIMRDNSLDGQQKFLTWNSSVILIGIKESDKRS